MRDKPPRPPQPPSETIQRLAEQYAARHRSMENYILAWNTAFAILRRWGIDPLSWVGSLANVLYVVVLMLGVPLVVTAITGGWSEAPVLAWAAVALVFGVLGVVIYPPFYNAIDEFLSLHRALADEAGLRRLIAWDRRVFSIRSTWLAGTVFSLAVLTIMFLGQSPNPIRVPAGSVVLGAMILYSVGEIVYSVFMLGIESRMLSAYDYHLYRLSPIDSIPLQRSIAGSGRIGALVGVIATIWIVGLVALLPRQSGPAEQLALILLIVAYVSTGFGILVPRIAMRRIIQLEKMREMAPLQRRLDHLTARVSELSDAEYEELQHLREVHDAIRDSSENVLPIETIGQFVSSLILPTIAFVAAVAGEIVIGGFLERFLP
jgi:hypothetical protein